MLPLIAFESQYLPARYDAAAKLDSYTQCFQAHQLPLAAKTRHCH